MSRPTRGGPNPMDRASRGLQKAGDALNDIHILGRHVLPQWFMLAERLVDQVERAVNEAELAVDLAYEAASKDHPKRKPMPERDDAARGE